MARIFRIAGVVTLTVLNAITARADDGNGTIFSGKSGIREGWGLRGFRGVDAQVNQAVVREPGGQSVEASLHPGPAQNWSGVALEALKNPSIQNNSVELTDQLRNTGIVELYLNDGKNAQGAQTGDQKLQFSINFIDHAGNVIFGKFKSMKQLGGNSDALDSDPSSWELVTIPVREILAMMDNAQDMVGISGVRVQYVGNEPPTDGFFMTDCAIKSEH
jgi:hypothetical protein